MNPKLRALFASGDVGGPERRYALALCGISQRDICRELGVDRAIVSRVLEGTESSYNVASHVAARVGLPLRTLWPDGRYARPPMALRASERSAA